MTTKTTDKADRNVISAVKIALADAYASNENGGSKIDEVCKIAKAAYKGKPVPEDDMAAILDGFVELRGWKEDTAKVRRSEAKTVLTVYNVLPECTARVRKESGGCNWRGAMRLATLLKKNDGKIAEAMEEFKKQNNKKKSPTKRVAAALKGWYEAAPAKRAAILKAADLLNIKLGIKLDA